MYTHTHAHTTMHTHYTIHTMHAHGVYSSFFWLLFVESSFIIGTSPVVLTFAHSLHGRSGKMNSSDAVYFPHITSAREFQVRDELQ